MSYSVDAFSKQVFGRLGEIAIVSELPSNPSILWPNGQVVFSFSDDKFYRLSGSEWINVFPCCMEINAQTGTAYTLVLNDRNKMVTLDNAGAVTVTIPTNAAVAFPVGAVVALAQLGAGVVTVQGDTGVTVNGASAGSFDLSGQYQTAALFQVAADVWVLSGGLVAPT
jgi:hypothetical protein